MAERSALPGAPLYLRALAGRRVAPRPAPAPANRGEGSPGAERGQSAPSPPPGRQLSGKFVEPRKTSPARWPSAERRVTWDGYLPRGLRNAGPAPSLAPSRPSSGLGSVAHGGGGAVHAGRQGGPACGRERGREAVPPLMLTVPGAWATPVHLARSPRGGAAGNLGMGAPRASPRGREFLSTGKAPPRAWVPTRWEDR